jgi:arylsulfatase A-like enzyme
MPPDLFLVVLDTARADAFPAWGGRVPTPWLERLCREGSAFARARAAAPWTLPSIASMFTGSLPTEHGISGDGYRLEKGRPTSPAALVKAHEGPWLPEALAERGYATWAVSCNPWITRWGGFDRGFHKLKEILPRRPLRRGRRRVVARRATEMIRADHGGREAAQAAQRLMAGVDGRPQFGFVNLMEMHAPYDPPFRDHPAIRRGRPPVPAAPSLLHHQLRQMGMRRSADASFLLALRALYSGAARYTDRLVGRIVEAVEGRGRPAVVVVVSDHGENLGEHGLFAHNSSLHETLLRVPLVAWGHEVSVDAGTIEEPVSLLWLRGWLEALAEGRTAPPATGSGPVVSEYESTARHMGIPPSLRGRAREDLPALLHQAGLAVTDGGLKYVVTETGEESLFDLEADPGEEHDALDRFPDVLGRYRALRAEWEARRARGSPVASGDVADEEIAGHLQALGYIE